MARTLDFYTQVAREYAPQGKITRCARSWYEKAKERDAEREGNRDPLPRQHGQSHDRMMEKIRQQFVAEIDRRGFDTVIWEGRTASDLRPNEVAILDRDGRGLYLLGTDGWRFYSRRYSARTALRYLCGVDDNGPWAVRVPGTAETVEEALEYTIPAEVKKAVAQGKRVIRQGDVFAVELKRDGKQELPEGHTFDPETRMLTHEGGHETVHVPFPCKFVTAIGLPPRTAYRSNRWWD